MKALRTYKAIKKSHSGSIILRYKSSNKVIEKVVYCDVNLFNRNKLMFLFTFEPQFGNFWYPIFIIQVKFLFIIMKYK